MPQMAQYRRTERRHTMDKNAATVMMVDSNLARSNILPSEKAFAYKMRLDAMKRLPGRSPKKGLQVSPYSIDLPLVISVSLTLKQLIIGKVQNALFSFLQHGFIKIFLQSGDERRIFDDLINVAHIDSWKDTF